MNFDKWAERALICLVLLVAASLFIASEGRARGNSPYGEQNSAVTILLVVCLLAGATLSLAVPILSMFSLAADSARGKLIALAALLIEAIAVVLSVLYVFPYGFGK